MRKVYYCIDDCVDQSIIHQDRACLHLCLTYVNAVFECNVNYVIHYTCI